MLEAERLIFDVECYPNFFICAMRLREKNKTAHEHCFRIGERERARKALSRRDCVYVSHNGLGYDQLMTACWLDGANETELYQLNNYLIMNEKPSSGKVALWVSRNVSTSIWEKFGNSRIEHKLGWDAQKRFGWNERCDVDTLVLGEKSGSLKNAAINLGFCDLVEAPVEFGNALTDKEKELVVQYCFNDCTVTEKLFEWYSQTIEVRRQFYEMGIKQAYVVGSAKLAELYLLKRYENSMGNTVMFSKWKLEAYDASVLHRKFDPVLDLLGNYKIRFIDSGFRTLWDRIKHCDLVYSDSILLKNCDIATPDDEDFSDWVKKMHEPSPYRNKDGAHLPKGDLIVTDDRGMRYQIGVGGLHNIAPRGIWKENTSMCIYNSDVISFYPSLIVSNNYAPRQFPEFSVLLGKLLGERKAKKKAGMKVEEQALKLVLNSSFGKTKSAKSIMFDPKCHFSVTVSGQLLLLMLIDMVYQVSPESTVINANTDGVCFYAPRSDIETIKVVMKCWEMIAKVKLEGEYYRTFAQSTCNLYCALGEDGKIKSKGGGWKLKPTAMRETMAESMATKKMAIECLLHGKHPLETCATLSKEDFAMSAGFGGKRTLVVDGVPQRERRALRYAWVKQGSILQKLEKRGLSIVGEGQQCLVLDTMDALDDSNISRDYYVDKAMAKVLEIVGTHTTNGLPKKVLKNLRENFDTWFTGQRGK